MSPAPILLTKETALKGRDGETGMGSDLINGSKGMRRILKG